MAVMLGFLKEQEGVAVIANRIFEMRLYNLYLSAAQMQESEIYRISLQDRNQFPDGGQLNMRLVLEKFVLHFHEIYGDRDLGFLEEEGRKYFLLYLRPVAREYHQRGEEQLAEYLEDYHAKKGYLSSFNFNQKKQTGVYEVKIGDKTLMEAVV